jgi:hypothetical protein
MSGGVSNSFEDNILTNISTATGDTFGADDVEVEEQVEVEEAPKSPVPEKTEPTDEEADSSLKQQAKPQPERKPKFDKQGNLLNDQGEKIANRGEARRLHLKIERLTSEASTYQNRVKELEQELQTAKKYGDLPTQLGLKPEQVADAFEMAASFQRDPAATVKEMIARALANGVELRQIVDDEFIPNLSMRANALMMEQHLKPAKELLDSQQANRQQQEQAEKLRSEAIRFIDDFADQGADVHASDIAVRMQEIRKEASRQGRQIDQYSAAAMALSDIRAFCFQHGLDPMQPIKPQIEARQSAPRQTSNGRGRSSPTPQSRRPMPNGSGRNTATEQTSTFADPNDDNGSIVRQVMREQGYEV